MNEKEKKPEPLNKETSFNDDERDHFWGGLQEGHVDVVERLVAAGSDVNQRSLDGKTPLRAAALECHTDVVGVLLRCDDTDVAYRDADGRSTLYLLAIENRLAQVEVILKVRPGLPSFFYRVFRLFSNFEEISSCSLVFALQPIETLC